ncbi:MAG: hypothetical protein JST16_03690 [Bdellovibrionales bacterium]|nr:hypothetical protein [Bdellovibrionales bacterium]
MIQKLAMIGALISFGAQATVQAYIPADPAAHQVLSDCLKGEVQKQMPADLGTLLQIATSEFINEKNNSLLDVFMMTARKDGTREGLYLELKVSNDGPWLLLQGPTISEYAEAPVATQASLVDWKTYEQKVVVDINACVHLMTP